MKWLCRPDSDEPPYSAHPCRHTRRPSQARTNLRENNCLWQAAIAFRLEPRCIPQLSVAAKPAPRGGTRPTKERTETVGPVPPPGATGHRQLVNARLEPLNGGRI